MKKNNVKKIIFGAVAGLIAFNAMIYLINDWKKIHIEFSSENDYAQTGGISQGNYVLLSEGNGIWDFPFIFGEKLKLMSIPDGKEYIVADDIGFLDGVCNPIIKGNDVYWEEAWDGSSQGYFYTRNIENKQIIERDIGFIYGVPFAFSGKELYYLHDENYTLHKCNLQNEESELLINVPIKYFVLHKDNLYCCSMDGSIIIKQSIRTGEEEIFHPSKELSGDIRDMKVYKENTLLIQFEDRGIYRYDLRAGALKKIADNGDLAGGIISANLDGRCLKVVGDNLYYYDAQANIFKYDLLQNKSKGLFSVKDAIISEFNITQEDHLCVMISQCDDYFVAQFGYMEKDEKYSGAIMAFDYQGNKVLQKEKKNISNL